MVDDEINITSMIKTRLEYTGEYEVMALSDAKDIVRCYINSSPLMGEDRWG